MDIHEADQLIAGGPPPVVEPKPPMEEIFQVIAARFGCTVAELMAKSEHTQHPLNIPRNVGVMVASVAGYTRAEIAFFTVRAPEAIQSVVQTVVRKWPARVRLAWGIWHELGGSWDRFEKHLKLRPEEIGDPLRHVEIMELPRAEDYVIAGVTREAEAGDAVPILRYFTRNMELTPDLLRHLGLGERINGEKRMYCNLLRQAISDYLLGEDAKGWLMIEEQSDQDGISMSDACTMLGLNADGLRRKLIHIAELVAKSRTPQE